MADINCINEEDICGVELKISIRFNSKESKKYIDIVTELFDDINDVIEESGHTYIVGIGKPILKNELE